MNAYEGLAIAATTLAEHLDQHPNKLYRLRLTVLFVSLRILRHLSLLEATYLTGVRMAVQPWLVDFSDKRNSMVAQASALTYMHFCQSVSRFYGWAFGNVLKTRHQLTADELRASDIPTYRDKVSPESREIWNLASFERAYSDEETYSQSGGAMYDMLCLQADGHPIAYLRQLGSRSGFFDPPVHTHPNKRFKVQQDTLEMLVRGAVRPGETVTMPRLLDRFWERYGIMIGSRPVDQHLLLASGIYQADSDSLKDNRLYFEEALQSLSFARILGDGVLQVSLEA